MSDWITDFKASPEFAELATRPIAYFCAEYALDPSFLIYAGGLGILAADYIREANDLLLPVVGVGLYYGTTRSMKVTLMKDESGAPIQVTVPIQDRSVKIQIYRYFVGATTPVYLLDTNVEENSPADQIITSKLYVSDRETRLKQEIILGIGGLRALEALKIHPLKYHLNEGHSAFLGLELIHHEMESKKVSLKEAEELAKKRIVFTNHTLLPAGRDVFSNDLVALMLEKYAQEIGVPVMDIVKLGQVQESSTFSMTMLPLRLSDMTNAVSRLHAQKGGDIWADHPMKYVTNGIHIPTWDSIKSDVSTPGKFRELHQVEKRKILKIAGQNWSEDTLLLGWARRFVEYKRPLAILENLERFTYLARNTQKPVKIVFAGEPHESDTNGQRMVRKLQDLIKEQLGDIVAYLPGYNMEMAKLLVSGCDVWLNTPIVGFEACGTSGMKAALNGVLPCTTRDGWVDEVNLYQIGWILNNDNVSQDLLDVLEHNILPMYYENKDEWENLMRNARNMVLNQFSATRMVREYVEQLYFPKA